jgi:hypothetical protein
MVNIIVNCLSWDQEYVDYCIFTIKNDWYIQCCAQ